MLITEINQEKMVSFSPKIIYKKISIINIFISLEIHKLKMLKSEMLMFVNLWKTKENKINYL